MLAFCIRYFMHNNKSAFYLLFFFGESKLQLQEVYINLNRKTSKCSDSRGDENIKLFHMFTRMRNSWLFCLGEQTLYLLPLTRIQSAPFVLTFPFHKTSSCALYAASTKDVWFSFTFLLIPQSSTVRALNSFHFTRNRQL